MRPPITGYYADDVPPVPGLALYRFNRFTRRGFAMQVYIGSGELNALLDDHKTQPWYRPDDIVTWNGYPARSRRRLYQDELRAIVVNQPRFNCRNHKRHQCHTPPDARIGRRRAWECDEDGVGCGVRWYRAGDVWLPFPDRRR